MVGYLKLLSKVRKNKNSAMQHQQENRDKAYKTVSCSVSETYRLMLSMEKFWRTFQEYTEGK